MTQRRAIVESVNRELLAALKDMTDLAARYGAAADCDGNFIAARAAIARAEKLAGVA